MPIHFFPDQNVFCPHGPRFTYAFQVFSGGKLMHLYGGPRLSDRENLGEHLAGLLHPDYRSSFAASPAGESSRLSLDTLPREYPGAGGADRRMPAASVFRPADGSCLLELRYASQERRVITLRGSPRRTVRWQTAGSRCGRRLRARRCGD